MVFFVLLLTSHKGFQGHVLEFSLHFFFSNQKRKKINYFNSQDLADAKSTQRNKKIFQVAAHAMNSMIILAEKRF